MKRTRILGLKYHILSLRKEGKSYREISQSLLEKFNLDVSYVTIRKYLDEWLRLSNLPTRQSVQEQFLRLSHLDQHAELERRKDFYIKSLHHTPLGLFRDADFDARLFTAKQKGLITDDDIYELLYTHTMFVAYFYDSRGGGAAATCECTGYFRDKFNQYQFDDVDGAHDLHFDIVLPRALSLVFDWKNGRLYALVRSLIKKRTMDFFIKLAKDGERGQWFDILSLDKLNDLAVERDYPSAFDPTKEMEEPEYPVYFNYTSTEGERPIEPKDSST
jgi:hypothetical protein